MATNINFGEDTLIVSEDVAEVLRALEERPAATQSSRTAARTRSRRLRQSGSTRLR